MASIPLPASAISSASSPDAVQFHQVPLILQHAHQQPAELGIVLNDQQMHIGSVLTMHENRMGV